MLCGLFGTSSPTFPAAKAALKPLLAAVTRTPFSAAAFFTAVPSHALTLTLTLATVAAALTFVVAELSRNFSQVDKLWSILPMLYLAVTAAYYPSNPRVLFMAGAGLVWGLRLTFNFYRRGGYDGIKRGKPWAGEEDYRWAHVMKWPVLRNPLGWALFDLVFIATFQNILLWAITLPAIAAGLAPLPPHPTVLSFHPAAIFTEIHAHIPTGLLRLAQTIVDQVKQINLTSWVSSLPFSWPFSFSFSLSSLPPSFFRWWTTHKDRVVTVTIPGHLTVADVALMGLWVCFFLMEVTADEQQQAFQRRKRPHVNVNVNAKPKAKSRSSSPPSSPTRTTRTTTTTTTRGSRRAKAPGDDDIRMTRGHAGDVRRGFCSSGLFAFSRHPAFFAEQAMWVTMAVLGVVATGALEWWFVAGAVGLVCLFQGSTTLTESISIAKYPAYEIYQARVPRLAPNPFFLLAHLLSGKGDHPFAKEDGGGR